MPTEKNNTATGSVSTKSPAGSDALLVDSGWSDMNGTFPDKSFPPTFPNPSDGT